MKWFLLFYVGMAIASFTFFMMESCRDTHSFHQFLRYADATYRRRDRICDYFMNFVFGVCVCLIWPVGIFLFTCLF